jgi:hypothetical protein
MNSLHPNANGMSKVEKLRVAGAIAPTVRRGSGRKVTVVSKTGEPIREMTLDEVQAALAKRQDIEFSLRDDAPQTMCAGWDGPCPDKAKPSKGAFRSNAVRRRKGQPWRCYSCAARMRESSIPEENRRARAVRANARLSATERSERSRRASAVSTPQQRSDRARKGVNGMSPEQLSMRARKAAASSTAEQRSARARAGASRITAEHLSERGRKGNAGLSHEQKVNAAKKAREVLAATRRAKAAAKKERR